MCALQVGIDTKTIVKGLESFKGVSRRLEHKGTVNQIDFYDDYAHHPTEVEAVLSGFSEKFPNRRICVLFQPHRYSRLKICWKDFLNCFEKADQLYMSPVYPAGESPLKNVSSEHLIKKMSHKNKVFVSNEDVVCQISRGLKAGDIFITMGAGSVYRFGENIFESLKSD